MTIADTIPNIKLKLTTRHNDRITITIQKQFVKNIPKGMSSVGGSIILGETGPKMNK